MTDYTQYLHGINESVDELRVFEIGGLGRGGRNYGPIINKLCERKADRVVYRGIDSRDWVGRKMPRSEYGMFF